MNILLQFIPMSINTVIFIQFYLTDLTLNVRKDHAGANMAAVTANSRSECCGHTYETTKHK